MTVFDAILLGLIQGLTEFIPVSSTAHLTLAGKLLGLVDSQNSAAWTEFMAIMQMGTLAAVIVYFAGDLFSIIKSVINDLSHRIGKRELIVPSDQTRMGWYVIVGTIPVGLIGLAFSNQIHGWFTKSTSVIIVSLIVLALLLWLAERSAKHVRTLESITLKDALIIGTAQAMALIPGSSRSGTTITAGLFLNLTRESAARFSFLLSIPAVLASGLYEMMKIDGAFIHLGYGNLIVSTVVAGISGYAAIAWLLRYLSRNSTLLFVWYRIGLGLVLLLMLHYNLIQP